MSEVGANRPRVLNWYLAGSMLFGDLGTSRLYVLGLAFYFSRYGSFIHIILVNALLLLVGGCYLIICRKYPDGGGVYSSARNTNRTLAVIGGLMLCADYTVTASMSCLDAFRYFGVSGTFGGIRVELICIFAAFGLIGGINWFGPKGMGRVALVVALGSILLTLVIGIFALPHLNQMKLDVVITHRYSPADWGNAWVTFTEVVLALSGIEAIANMTGLMVPTVRETSRKAILPVLVEVVVLNIVLTAAMNALPDSKLFDNEGKFVGTDDMMNILAVHYVGATFGLIGSFVFGSLLLSAINTAITDLMAIQYMMGRDGEIPGFFCRLNSHGVPIYGLGVALLFPLILLLIFSDLTQLAGLYSVGVVSAITINLFCTGFTRQFQLQRWESTLLRGVGIFMAFILVTLLWNKPNARVFSMTLLNLGLSARLFTLSMRSALPFTPKIAMQVISGLIFLVVSLLTFFTNPENGYLFFVTAGCAAFLVFLSHFAAANLATTIVPIPMVDLEGDYDPKSNYLLCVSKSSPLIHSVIEEALSRNAEVTILYVKEVSVSRSGPLAGHHPEEDPVAMEIFNLAMVPAHRLGVPVKFVYLVGGSIVDLILKTAKNTSANRIYLQVSQRSAIVKFMKGDVIGPVAEQMPQDIELIICA